MQQIIFAPNLKDLIISIVTDDLQTGRLGKKSRHARKPGPGQDNVASSDKMLEYVQEIIK